MFDKEIINKDRKINGSGTGTPQRHTIALVGLGTIGLSLAATHLKHAGANVRLFDVREDLEQHVASLLPVYLESQNAADDEFSVQNLLLHGRMVICSSIEEACTGATIVQEQGPETLAFKKATWARVVKQAPATAHLWSSTSGILASKQVEDLEDLDKSRLCIVHPFNPPHITPLIEIVPSPYTDPSKVQFAKRYFEGLNAGYRPVVINKEITGFVGNRLAFALFREACYLVNNDVVSAQDLDAVVEASFGPRWAVAGPFKLWHWGGGAGGLESFFRNLSGTMEACWEDAGNISFKGTSVHGDTGTESHTSRDDWPGKIAKQTQEAYGSPTPDVLAWRDIDLRRVLQALPKKR